jgi:hypothetical protein
MQVFSTIGPTYAQRRDKGPIRSEIGLTVQRIFEWKEAALSQNLSGVTEENYEAQSG